jgi:hypothetical protein
MDEILVIGFHCQSPWTTFSSFFTADDSSASCSLFLLIEFDISWSIFAFCFSFLACQLQAYCCSRLCIGGTMASAFLAIVGVI